MKVGVVCYIIRDGKVLLAMKKRGFGEGFWNGPGGKPKEGEGLVEALHREVEEELGIVPRDPVEHGTLHFVFEDDNPDWRVHVFRAEGYEGEPAESEEMRPAWFAFDEIPYDSMWADDPHWMPLLLEGKRFEGRFAFRDTKTLTAHEVREI